MRRCCVPRRHSPSRRCPRVFGPAWAYHGAMSTRTVQTFEQFEQFQDDGMKHELLKGEHIVLPPPKSRHSSIQHNLLHLLWPYVKQHQLGDVRIETGFKLSSDTWLQPDRSVDRRVGKKCRPRGYP